MKHLHSTSAILVSIFLTACGSDQRGTDPVLRDAGPDRSNPDTNQPDINTPDTRSPDGDPTATLTSLVVNATSSSVAVGATLPITAKAFYSDSSSIDVTAKATWKVTPSTSATISAGGVLTGSAAGTATVQASFGGKDGTLDITVIAAGGKLATITVTAAAASFDVGNTDQFHAQGTYSDGSLLDITGKVTWTSSDNGLATVSALGVATAVSAGTVTMKAALDGKEGTFALTVTKPEAALSGIAVTAPAATVDVGATIDLAATGTYADNSKKPIASTVTWTSSDPTIATVTAKGTVTGVKEGTVTLKAALSGKEGTVTIKVTTPITLSSVAVTASASSVTVGGKAQLTANEVYSDGSKKDVTKTATWKADPTTVATVDANGQVTAVKAGSVTVTATSGGKSGSATITVTDVPLTSIGIVPAQPSIPAGSTQQFKATGTYADDTKRDITAEVDWTSSPAIVATISGAAGTKGLATAKAKGTATITAALGGKTGTATLTVTDALLTSIVLSVAAPAKTTIAKGTTVAVIATGNYGDNTTKDLTALATWSTSAQAIASVSNADGSDGLVTGLGNGSTIITAVYSGQSATLTIKVNDVALTALDIKPAGDATLAKGTTLHFSAWGTFSDKSTQDLTTLATWASSDGTVATVGDGGGKDGLATALKVGATNISAAFAGKTATVKLTVTPTVLQSILITAPQTTIANGTAVQFTATGTYQDGTKQDLTTQVTWSSSVATVATVANDVTDGLATALGVGTTTVKATLGAVTATTTLTVTNATLSSIAVTPSPATVVAGRKVTLTATGTFSDGSKQDLTTLVNWTSTDYSVATPSNAKGSQGVVQGLKVGSAIILATFDKRGGQSTVTVTAAEPDHVVITAPAKIAKGTTAALAAKVVYSDTTEVDVTAQAVWTSTPATIATFSTVANAQGQLTGLAVGTTSITAVKGTLSAQVNLTVSNATLTTLVVKPATVTVAKNASTLLTATGTFSDNSTQDLTIQADWHSLVEATATVSNLAGSHGKVTGVAAGTTTISGTTLGKTDNATVTVTP